MATLAAEATLAETESSARSSETEAIAENSNSADGSASTVVASASSSSAAAAAASAAAEGSVSDSDEIATISRQIRRALECPICLTLMSVMSCYCPNGHAVCESCMLTLINMNGAREHPCPLCRTSMAQSLITSATADKLTELSRLVKVKCSNSPRGCTKLVPVRYANEHESGCLYVPNVSCQVTACQWLGVYEQLYEHVRNTHPGVAVRTPTNRLNVDDVKDIATNRRRTYLVRSTYGMMWVLLSRVARSRIQTALFLVNNHRDGYLPAPDKRHVELLPPEIVYRVTWFDANDRSRTRSRTKGVNWSTSLNPGCQILLPNTYTTFRSRTGRMEINWYRCPRYNRSHTSSAQ